MIEKNKGLIGLIVFLCIILAGIMIYKTLDSEGIVGHNNSSNILHTEVTSITPNIVKANVKDNIDDLKSTITDLKKSNSLVLKEVLKRNKKNSITEIGTATGRISGYSETTISNVIAKANSDDITKIVQDSYVVKWRNKNKDELTLAKVQFELDNKTDKDKWTVVVNPIGFHVTIVETEGKESDRYLEMFATDDSQSNSLHFPITIDSKDVIWVKKPILDKHFVFNPRLGVSASLGKDIFPQLNLSLFSYGKTKGDMDYRFAIVGVGGDSSSTKISFSPIEYNIGHHLPLVDNIFIGPDIYYDLNSNNENSSCSFGAEISVPF